jgi:hypothetical protein
MKPVQTVVFSVIGAVVVVLGQACTVSVDPDVECTGSCDDEKQTCYEDCDTECVNADGDQDESCDTDCHDQCDSDAEECTVTCSSSD